MIEECEVSSVKRYISLQAIKKKKSNCISLSGIWTSVHSRSRTRASLGFFRWGREWKQEAGQQSGHDTLSANVILDREDSENKATPTALHTSKVHSN